jgi:plastocyanin
MYRKLAALALALGAAALAACAGHSGSGSGTTFALPGMPDLQITAQLPNGKTGTVSEELPGEGLGTVDDSFWQATLGGFTQQQFSQALGFPPGTKLTIKNIASGLEHTLNVIQKDSGPPADFPSNPNLSLSPSGSTIKVGYASGAIQAGSSVTVTAKKPGNYLIGCAFHYHEGMMDVLVIKKGATPGPQGTAPAQ